MKLILQAPINRLGYGVVGSNFARELAALTNLTLFPIGNIDGSCLEPSINQAIENRKTTDYVSPTVKIFHQHLLTERAGYGMYFGFPIFELNQFTEEEKISMRAPHEIIVCSQWAKTIVQYQIPNKPVYVVPLGVNTDIFYPGEVEHKPYRFFNIGKTEVRKGHDVLVECFNRAFDKSDNVELHMKWHNPFYNQEQNAQWHNLYKQSKLGDKITFHGPGESQSSVADLMRSCDCGVFPARAEGWNLELLESMACGKPVITTNYSAHTEFCNNDNARLIHIEDLEPAYDGVWFHGQGDWAYIGEEQKEQLIEHMRFCYKNRPSNDAGIKTAQHYSWKSAASKLVEIIKDGEQGL